MTPGYLISFALALFPFLIISFLGGMVIKINLSRGESDRVLSASWIMTQIELFPHSHLAVDLPCKLCDRNNVKY